MTKKTIKDYPLAENQSANLVNARDIPLDEITLENVVAGKFTIEDFRITQDVLLSQAEIARDSGRETLARNFERASELVDVPGELIVETYEMLRPGRVKTKTALMERAAMFREKYNAQEIADFIEHAAEIACKRGVLEDR